jgi:hypothetical protein
MSSLHRPGDLGVTHGAALLRLLPRSDHDKDSEILVLRHQIAELQRQLGGQRIRFRVSDRALLAAPHPLSRTALHPATAAGPPGHDPALAPPPARRPPRHGTVPPDYAMTTSAAPAMRAARPKRRSIAVHPRAGRPTRIG